MEISHRPEGYRCPFCRVVAGEDLAENGTRQSDIVWRDEAVTAFICSAWWPENAGHLLVVPNGHYEHVYALPDADLAAVQIAGKWLALALRAVYGATAPPFASTTSRGRIRRSGIITCTSSRAITATASTSGPWSAAP